MALGKNDAADYAGQAAAFVYCDSGDIVVKRWLFVLTFGEVWQDWGSVLTGIWHT